MLDVGILIFHSSGLSCHMPTLTIELIGGLEVTAPRLNVGDVCNGSGRHCPGRYR